MKRQNNVKNGKPAQSILLKVDPNQNAEEISVEKHYSVPELAELWQLSEKTIRRIFENESGVIVWGVGETRFKRRYRTLRIPASVVERVHQLLRIAS